MKLKTKYKSLEMGKTNFSWTGLGFHATTIILASMINASFPELGAAQEKESQVVGVNVGVVLDTSSVVGKMGLSSIKMAVSDLYGPNGNGSSFKTRLVLKVRDSKRDVILAAAAALDHIKNEQVKAIIGPSTSDEAAFVGNLGDKAKVPILTFSATSPYLSFTKNAYFFRASQSDSAQAQAIAALIQAFGWREAVPIYTDTMYGRGLFPSLTDALEGINARVPYQSVVSASATDDQIIKELSKLMAMQTRVFIVHMSHTLGSRLFQKANEMRMMEEGFVWITTDGITNLLGSMSPSVVSSAMQGVLGVRTYVPQTRELEKFRVRWKTSFRQDNLNDNVDAQLNVYALWAYDATMALATAIEKVGASINALNNSVAWNKSLTDLEAFRVSQNGPSLRMAMLNASFQGFSGGFSLANGQLPVSTFQIVNVIGSSARGVGFWTEQNGIKKELNSTPNAVSKTAKGATAANLRTIVWPGDTTSPPKGWVVPTSGTKLRIGVPLKNGFTEFVKVTRDSDNKTNVTGYCIDIFIAVMGSLNYSVPYEFHPFEKPEGVPAGDYDEMLRQVFLKEYDAVVGDITIRANRSQHVDFTLPYTESGVVLIVPMTSGKNKNPWIFLQPLTWQLWFTIFGFFIFIGFVIWVLEHRINDDFRGPPGHQAGTMLWFSFSAMVFAHRERVESNMARFVGIVWVFVLLILTQSYTASLTSMLTIQRMQPTVTNINQLLKTGQYVGYQQGSFVKGLLKQMKFQDWQLREFSSMEELDEALNTGSESGGVAAALDEFPYMKLFLAKYHSKYTMVQPTYKADGFGFVFPKGSPLVADVSRAILSVTEGDLMTQIEAKYFSHPSGPDTTNPTVPSTSMSLGLDSFSGLFLIAAVAATSALLYFIGTFLYQHSHILIHPTETNSDNNSIPADDDAHTMTPRMVLSRVVELGRRFDSKDLSWHTFREQAGSTLGLVNFASTDHGTSTTDPTADPEINHGDAVAKVAVESSGPTNEEVENDQEEREIKI